MNEYHVWLPGELAPQASVVVVRAESLYMDELRKLVFTATDDDEMVEAFAAGCWSRWKLVRRGVE